MNDRMKNILRKAGIYHSLQGRYRSAIDAVRSGIYQYRYGFYKGGDLECNFCGACYSRFVPEFPPKPCVKAIEHNSVIAGYGENVYCPKCLSKNRDRLVKAIIDHRYHLIDKRILHLSPEPSLYKHLSQSNQVTTADLEPGFYERIDQRIERADATSLPYARHQFEAVIANHILEHIPEDLIALREIHRVLKPGGLAILQVPYSETITATIEDKLINDPAKQEELFGQRDHVRIYSLQDYVGRLTEAGFKANLLTPADLSEYRRFAIQENESFFVIIS